MNPVGSSSAERRVASLSSVGQMGKSLPDRWGVTDRTNGESQLSTRSLQIGKPLESRQHGRISRIAATLGPMPSPPTIRQAHPQDRPGVLATVTAAFAEDPGWAFLMGKEYERLAPEFVGALFDLRAPGGNVWVGDNLATVAMWESPGGDDDEQWTRTKKPGRATYHWPARKPTNDSSPTKPRLPPSARQPTRSLRCCYGRGEV
jgi:hypothetical protein